MKNNYATLTLMETGELAFEFSYNAGMIASLKAKIPYTARKWDSEQKLWKIDPAHAETCRDLVMRHFGFGLDIPEADTTHKAEVRTFTLYYLGSAKDKGNGNRVAMGNDGADDNGGWNYTFAETVLREYFNLPLDPTEATTYYGVLGIQSNASGAEIKKAYRRAARTYHPDANSAPDAKQQFQAIQEAYEVLSNPRKKARYDSAPVVSTSVTLENWKSPLNCGFLVVEGYKMLGRFNVEKIIAWEDVYKNGKVMVTYWGYDRDAGTFDETYTVNWI